MMKALARTVLPASAWDQLRILKYRISSATHIRRQAERFGFLVAQKTDYYTPLSSVDELRATAARWNRPSRLAGVQYDIAQMKQSLRDLLSRYYEEFSRFPRYQELTSIGFGPGYTAVDALTLYAMVRHLKPKRYLEVGSGLSTFYCSLAAEQNAREGHPVEITCIEPHPYPRLTEIPGIRLHPAPVQDVDLGAFETLQPGDILFIDSTHVVKIDGDVPYLFLEVLPSLQRGVHVHVHDVPFPYNIPYPPELWIFGRDWPMLWNEAMMVQAFLCGNRDFRITMSTPLLRHFDEPFLRAVVPIYESVDENPNAFSSLWLHKVA